MCVACCESVTSQRQCHYRFKIGSPLVSIVIFRTVRIVADSSRQGRWDIVRNASRSNELPDPAGGLAVRIGGCRRRDGIHPPGCDDSRDIGTGSCHGSGATAESLVRGPITSKHLRASRMGLRAAHPLIWSDPRGSRVTSPDNATIRGLGERCFGRSAPPLGVDRNLLKRMGFRRSLRRTSPRSRTTVGTLAIPALGRDWTTGRS